jgi:hypothetical protein
MNGISREIQDSLGDSRSLNKVVGCWILEDSRRYSGSR